MEGQSVLISFGELLALTSGIWKQRDRVESSIITEAQILQGPKSSLSLMGVT